MTEHNLPVPDDAPWLNQAGLSQQEIEELRNKKHSLTEYGKQKLKKLMTEPLHAKVSDEDFQKIVEAFDNPQPYPEEMLDAARTANKLVEVALEKQEWELKVRNERILQRYNEYHNLETSGLPHGQPITAEHQQIIAMESMIDAIRCEYLNREYNHIAIEDIENLVEGLRNQANEFLKRVRTLSTNVETTENSEND